MENSQPEPEMSNVPLEATPEEEAVKAAPLKDHEAEPELPDYLKGRPKSFVDATDTVLTLDSGIHLTLPLAQIPLQPQVSVHCPC